MAFLMVVSPIIAMSQIVIGRHVAPYDSTTNTWLATVPEDSFGRDGLLLVTLGKKYRQLVIGEDTVTPGNTILHLFRNICADSTYTVVITDTLDRVSTGQIQFTFLPVVQLQGTFGYEYSEGTVLLSCPDSLKTDTLTATIKWRGGTTNAANKHKRNYKVKLSEDHKLLGLRKDNNWILDAGQPDVFRMRNRIAMDLWNKMARKPYYADQKPNARNGVRGRMVEVFLNDEYRGIYNMSEAMDRKQLNLKKMDEETGEIHGCLYKGVSWDKTQMYNFLSNYDNTKDTFYGYEMKYPDLGDSDTIDWAPLVSANNFVYDSTDEEFQQQVGDYFDMPVLTDYNIFFNVVNAVDNTGKNMYWAIFDKATTKRFTPTPWDLDATFGQRWGGILVRETEEGFFNSPEFRLDFELFLTYRLFRDNFNDYVGLLNERYKQLRQPGQPLHTDSILAIVDSYYQAVKNSGAARREAAKWSGDSDMWGDVIDFDAEYAYICDWIRQRMDFIDQTELPLFYKKSYFDSLGIQPFTISSTRSDNVYDLGGRRVRGDSLKPGLYVRNGRRFIVR